MDDSSAQAVVAQFNRMVRRDGGALTLIALTDNELRVGYRPGSDPTCDDDGCVLPHIELQQLISETVARRSPGTRVVVELTR